MLFVATKISVSLGTFQSIATLILEVAITIAWIKHFATVPERGS